MVKSNDHINYCFNSNVQIVLFSIRIKSNLILTKGVVHISTTCNCFNRLRKNKSSLRKINIFLLKNGIVESVYHLSNVVSTLSNRMGLDNIQLCEFAKH